MTWTQRVELIGKNIRKSSIIYHGKPLSYSDVIEGWRGDSEFIHYFSSLLKTSPYDAYFWETPPVCVNNLHRDFEYVEINSAVLNNASTDRTTFNEYFLQSYDGVAVFDNLGADAHLVVPCPENAQDDFPHLAAFMRNASDRQIELFWNSVARQVGEYLSESDMWVSTAGSGVAWLHLRLDSFPKYYAYHPYKVGNG